jgi:hypothetical protein
MIKETVRAAPCVQKASTTRAQDRRLLLPASAVKPASTTRARDRHLLLPALAVQPASTTRAQDRHLLLAATTVQRGNSLLHHTQIATATACPLARLAATSVPLANTTQLATRAARPVQRGRPLTPEPRAAMWDHRLRRLTFIRAWM